MTNEIVLSILDYIDNNLYNEITIDNIAKSLCYDKSYLMKVFKKEMGLSIISYVNMLKVINSLELFYDDNYILGICMNSGFNSIEYFSEIFKAITGVNPSTYRKYINGNEISLKDKLLIDKFNLRTNMYLNYINNYRNGIKDNNIFKLLLENKAA